MAAAGILKLQRAGFTEEQVEALAEYFDEQMATKADLAAAEARLDSTVQLVRFDLNAGLAAVRAEVATTEARLEAKIEQSRFDTIKWVVGVGFAQVAMILAVLRFLPVGHP